MYDPIKLISKELDHTRLALPGNRGIFTHPSLRRPGTHNGSRTQRFASVTQRSKHTFNF